MIDTSVSDKDFDAIRKILHEIAGITLSREKKTLVFARLSKRIAYYQLNDFSEYLGIINDPKNAIERKLAVDLLTTNETSFYREPQHFSFLQDILKRRETTYKPFRVWSAACSSGQEPYSIAMLLASDCNQHSWEIVASDISDQVLEKAKKGKYRIEEIEKIPEIYLKKYCLKGVGVKSNTFILNKCIREKVQFYQINLNSELPKLGAFDVVFLRNVMIYFDIDKKREIISNILTAIKPGGYLFIGHSESLYGITDKLKLIIPAVYQNPNT